MIPNGGIDPDLQEKSGRDDFRRGNASWLDKNVWEGWFSSGKLILICGKSLTGMISNSGMHPDSREKSRRDDFQLGNSSWFAGSAWPGCILGHGEHPYPYPKNSKKWKNYLQFENSDDTIRFAVRENRISQDNNFLWIWIDFQENEKSCWQERDHMIFYQSCCWGTRSNNEDLPGRNTSKDVRKILNQIVTIK